MIVKTYPYKPRLLNMILVVLFFGVATVMTASYASTIDHGTKLFRIVELSPDGASYILWMCAAVSMLFALSGLWGIYQNLTSTAELVLSRTSITVPKGVVRVTTQSMDF